MRILFNTLRTDNLVTLNVLYHLEQEVSKLAECKWSGKGWKDHIQNEKINKTVERLYGNDPPDFIVDNNADLSEFKRIAEEKTAETPQTVMTINDMHLEPREWVKTANRGFDGALMRYLYCSYEKVKILSRFDYMKKMDDSYYLDNLTIPYIHFPWFTDERIYGPSDEKEYDVAFLGSYRKRIYPLRHEIYNSLPSLCKEMKCKYLLSDRPPGKTTERRISDLSNEGYFVGESYARALAKSKIFIFGNSIFDYPISKYFEVMGCRSLVMADKPQTATELHFESGYNYVEIDRTNWKEKLRYYLDNDDERERIARNGYNTVMKYHNSRVRAKQLVEFLGKLLKS